MNKNIEVSWVPLHQIGASIEIFGYYLLRGLKAADIQLSELVESLGITAYIGVAYEVNPFRPLGCWVSDLRDLDDGFRFATVYALAGERLPSWIDDVQELVTAWARDNNCHSVRFHGRAAYRTLIDDLEVIGTSEDGRALLFEKRLIERNAA